MWVAIGCIDPSWSVLIVDIPKRFGANKIKLIARSPVGLCHCPLQGIDAWTLGRAKLCQVIHSLFLSRFNRLRTAWNRLGLCSQDVEPLPLSICTVSQPPSISTKCTSSVRLLCVLRVLMSNWESHSCYPLESSGELQRHTSAHSSYPKIVPVPSLYVCLPSSSFIFICFCHLLGSLLLGFVLLSVSDASVVLFLSCGHLLDSAWLPAPQSHPFLALDGSGQPWQLWANHPKDGRALRQGQTAGSRGLANLSFYIIL